MSTNAKLGIVTGLVVVAAIVICVFYYGGVGEGSEDEGAGGVSTTQPVAETVRGRAPTEENQLKILASFYGDPEYDEIFTEDIYLGTLQYLEDSSQMKERDVPVLQLVVELIRGKMDEASFRKQFNNINAVRVEEAKKTAETAKAILVFLFTVIGIFMIVTGVQRILEEEDGIAWGWISHTFAGWISLSAGFGTYFYGVSIQNFSPICHGVLMVIMLMSMVVHLHFKLKLFKLGRWLVPAMAIGLEIYLDEKLIPMLGFGFVMLVLAPGYAYLRKMIREKKSGGRGDGQSAGQDDDIGVVPADTTITVPPCGDPNCPEL